MNCVVRSIFEARLQILTLMPLSVRLSDTRERLFSRADSAAVDDEDDGIAAALAARFNSSPLASAQCSACRNSPSDVMLITSSS